jgi:hypothetical protein
MDELLGPQGTTFFSAGVGVAVAKGHTIIFQLEEAVVAQSDAENVRRQILQGIETRAHCLTVHNPLLLPDLGRDTAHR